MSARPTQKNGYAQFFPIDNKPQNVIDGRQRSGVEARHGKPEHFGDCLGRYQPNAARLVNERLGSLCCRRWHGQQQ
jgi:hypothetical protein